MKQLFLISIVCILSSCAGDSNNYPRSYTFYKMEQFPEGLFLLQTPKTAISLDINSGSYGKNRLIVKSETVDFIKYAFDLQEIELLSENTVRILIITEDKNIDTIVNYTMDEKNIVIQALDETGFIYYDTQVDQFVVCATTTLALPGPNVIHPDRPYYDGIIEDCLKNASLNEHLDSILAKDNYMPLDTIGIFFTKLIYK